MLSCILPDKVEGFKKALKDKDIKLSDLINLDHDKMVEKLTPHVGKDAEGVATLIESKLILKNRMLGMKNALNKLTKTGKYSPEKIAEAQQRLSEYRAAQQERIFSPKEHESYLGGLVEKELGFSAPKEVDKKVFDLTQAVAKAKETGDKEFGASQEYFNAKDKLEQYVDSQKPIDVREAIAKNIAVIGRNNLILGLSTPAKTGVGQAVNSALDMFTRRISLLKLNGKNGELIKDLNKKVWDFAMKTNRNVLGMEGLDDKHMLGFGSKAENFDVREGEKPAGKNLSPMEQVAKGTEAVAKASNYIAITLEHQLAFTKFYQKAWLDMADLMSTKIAESEKATDVKGRAAEIINDAVKIEPETEQGKALRKACQAQAARVTSTNDNALARYSLGIKKVLNNMIPLGNGKHFPLGDFMVAMAKIPSTVISNMVENAGAGIPYGIRDMVAGHEKTQSEDLETRLEGLTQFAQGAQKLARIAGSITLGAVLVNSIDKKDLRTDKWGNHFFRLGNTWINTEYLSFLSAAAGGMMEMKLGKSRTALGTAGEYVAGVSKSLTSLPGADEVKGVIENMSNTHFIQAIVRSAEQNLTDRGIPQGLRALFKHAETMPWFGPNTRPVDRLFFGAHGVESTQDVAEDKRESKQQAIERKREARNE